jgi:CheY-like chemotaxis protein
MNLCTNAYHAMQATGGRLDVTLKQIDLSYEELNARRGMKPGQHLQLTVQDSGHGMEPEILERIYEPYFTTKEPGKGTGLGLSVIHGIVKNHGGDIAVKSRPGQGTRFDVYLPVIDDVEVAVDEVQPPAATKGKEHILLIDDEAQIIDIEQQILERLGYSVTSKTDSAEALKEFSAKPHQFDLVITDMTMPKITGDRLARKMLEIKPNIPVILCTGFNETITTEKALSLGIDQLVMKPIVKDQLANLIRTVLDNPKAAAN